MNLKIFRNKSFVLMIIASFISSVGTSIQDISFSMYVLDLTKSGAMFATVLVLASLPQLILGPFCGVLADWFNKKYLIVIINLFNGAILIILSIFTVNIRISILMIYAIVMLLGFTSALYSPSSAGLLPIILDSDDLANGYTIRNYLSSIQALLGPILGALLYSLLGIGFVIFFNGLTFIIAAILQWLSKIPDNKKEKVKKSVFRFYTDFKEGINYVYSNKTIWWLAVSILIFNFFSIPIITVGNGYLAKVTFKVSNSEFSLIETVSVIATFVGPTLFLLIKNKISLEKLFQVVIFGSAVIIEIIGLISCNFINNNKVSFYIFLGIFFVLCVIEVPLNLAIMTMLQSSINTKFSGRVNGVISTLFMGIAPLGQICYGFIFDHVYIAIPYLISGAAYVIVILVYRMGLRSVTKEVV